MKNLLIVCAVLVFSACANSDSAAPATAGTGDLSGYQLSDIPGSDMKKAIKIDDSGILREEGFVLNGQKTGTWVTYFSDQKVQSITSYVNGLKNGLELQITDRNQVESQTSYANNQLHGRKVKYGFNRKVEEEANYANGQLNGVFRSYNKQGDLQREIHYKNGQLHGPNIFFADGVKTMEYEYKNGEKISGGIIEKKEQ